jgi:uncharacterized protein (TIGR02246 family)
MIQNKGDTMNNSHDTLQQDKLEIQSVVKGVENAFNRHDVDELDSYFTSNSARVSAFGKRLAGFSEGNEDYKGFFKGLLKDAYARYQIANVLFLGSIVAVVHVDQKPTTESGEVIEGGQESIAMYVMVKEDNTWRIAASQNTLVKN